MTKGTLSVENVRIPHFALLFGEYRGMAQTGEYNGAVRVWRNSGTASPKPLHGC